MDEDGCSPVWCVRGDCVVVKVRQWDTRGLLSGEENQAPSPILTNFLWGLRWERW